MSKRNLTFTGALAVSSCLLGGCLSPTEAPNQAATQVHPVGQAAENPTLAIAASIKSQSSDRYENVAWSVRSDELIGSSTGLRGKKIAFGAGGKAWMVADEQIRNGSAVETHTNAIYYWTASGNLWKRLSAPEGTDKAALAANLETDPAKAGLYYVNATTGGEVLYAKLNSALTGHSWSQIGDNMKDLGVGKESNGADAVWGVGKDGTIWHRRSATGTWSKPSMPNVLARKIAVDGNGIPWIIKADWSVAKSTDGGMTWTQGFAGSATAIGIGANGAVWILSTETNGSGADHPIYKLEGTAWARGPSAGKELAVNASGRPWITNTAGVAFEAKTVSTGYYLSGSMQWQPDYSFTMRQVAAGGSSYAWAITNTPIGSAGDFAIKRWDGTGWNDVPGGGVSIELALDNTPYLLNSAGDLWQGYYEGTTWTYTKNAAKGAEAAMGETAFKCFMLAAPKDGSGNYPLMYRDGIVWTGMGMTGNHIAMGPDGRLWISNALGDLYQCNTDGLACTPMNPFPGPRVRDFGVGGPGSGTVWVISDVPEGTYGDYAIYRKDGAAWTKFNGGAQSISIDGDGKPWIVNKTGTLYKAP